MVEPPVAQQTPQAQSSVEITRYKDGSVGWAIKLYQGSPLPELATLYQYDGELHARFVASAAPPRLDPAAP